jgi:hypothetical protein
VPSLNANPAFAGIVGTTYGSFTRTIEHRREGRVLRGAALRPWK